MKLIIWLVSLSIFGLAVSQGLSTNGNQTLIITGSTMGYLAPCGCTKPMSGGLKRRITAIRAWTKTGKTTVVDNGGLVSGVGRQDYMKAETLAETMKLVKVDAINYGLEEARLGQGMVAALDRLSGEALIHTGSTSIADLKVSGPFLIGGIDPRRVEMSGALGEVIDSVDTTVSMLIDQAREFDLVPVLMTRGDFDHASEIARKHKALKLIICSSKSSPYIKPKTVGSTLIVTPGEHGKFVLKIEWDGKKFIGYQFADLGPEFTDDKDATRLYQSYLARVSSENLISMLPREESAKFAGSKACASCHPAEFKTWSHSFHASALETLEKSGHDRDPDCVSCHVVGLSSINGFIERDKTPLLADVGCESCHGPARKHALNPMKEKTVSKAVDSCAQCHNPQHSPGFDFEEYWKKIAH